MPELPEVETTVKGLQAKVLKRTFVDVWSDWKKNIKKPADFELFKKELEGKKIIRVWRRAKNVIFELSEGYSLLIHMKMTGHLMVGDWIMDGKKWVAVKRGPLDEKINTFIHLVFTLDNGKMITLSDLRKFAKVQLWKTEELLQSEEFNSWGPEPLEKDFTFKKFKHIFENLPPGIKGKKGNIKQVIMDPEVIAGVGNIYASEALWWSRIHPKKLAGSLAEEELKSLYRAIQKVLLAGIKLGGESFADYRDIDGKKGRFDDERRVYKRERQRCFRCATPIERLKFGGRSAFFCPKCQML
jgi:formamidopyrimidine-DNA glycosylase